MTLKQKTNHLVRCDYCKNTTHYVYRVKIGDFIYNFCSGVHANYAKNNFDEKIAKGITPSNLSPIEEPSAEGDNLEDYGNN